MRHIATAPAAAAIDVGGGYCHIIGTCHIQVYELFVKI